jgi:hypothetical protein
VALTIDGSDPTGDLGDLLAAKSDYPSGGSNGDLLTKSGTTTAWAAPSVAGLTLITAESFSAVSSVSVDNCFTSTYNFYRFILMHKANTGFPTLSLRYRASGSDLTGAHYDHDQSYINAANRATNGTSVVNFALGSALDQIIVADIANPAVSTTFTSATGTGGRTDSILWTFHGHTYKQNAAVDGLTITTSAGTITGTIRIYGYRN